MIPSLEGLPFKAKEAPSPHEVRVALLDMNPVFNSLGAILKSVRNLFKVNNIVKGFRWNAFVN